NPATRQSFLLTRELHSCRDLEKLCAQWPSHPPTQAFRRALIESVASITRRMHAAGLNHRDYYLCHLWLEQGSGGSSTPPPVRLRIIDLHRAMRHRRVPLFWLIKDLAGLLFSAWDSGLTKSDCLRCMREYRA